MNFFKSKFFLITLSVVLALALLTGTFAALGFSGPVKLVLGTVSKPFMWFGTYVADGINGFFEVFTDYDRLKTENEALRTELDSLKGNAYSAEVLQKENQWLKDYINFADEHPDFKLTDTRVIAQQTDSYSTVLTLDKGAAHGIKKDMPVITADGVFGRVVEVGLDYCRVESIIEASSSVGAYVQRSGETGIVKGDSALRAAGQCSMGYVDSTADIRKGDKIYTSGGASSTYPSGLYIGEVSDFVFDEGTASLCPIISPAVDFSDISSIDKMMIVTGYGAK